MDLEEEFCSSNTGSHRNGNLHSHNRGIERLSPVMYVYNDMMLNNFQWSHQGGNQKLFAAPWKLQVSKLHNF